MWTVALGFAHSGRRSRVSGGRPKSQRTVRPGALRPPRFGNIHFLGDLDFAVERNLAWLGRRDRKRFVVSESIPETLIGPAVPR